MIFTRYSNKSLGKETKSVHELCCRKSEKNHNTHQAQRMLVLNATIFDFW